MPTVLYDADGNEKEVPTEEEINAKVEAVAKEKDSKIAEIDSELKKLQNKDFNFKRLKDMTEAEKEKLSAVERDLKAKQEKLEDDQRSFIEEQITERKNYAFSSLAGDDKELRAKLELHFKRLDPDKPATTQEAIMARAREAYVLAAGVQPQGVSSLSGAMGLQGSGMKSKTENSLDNEGRDLAKRLGLTDEDLKNV